MDCGLLKMWFPNKLPDGTYEVIHSSGKRANKDEIYYSEKAAEKQATYYNNIQLGFCPECKITPQRQSLVCGICQANKTVDTVEDLGDRERITFAKSSFSAIFLKDCQYCQREKAARNTFFPPHFARDNCQSGKSNHCSCGTCF